MAADSSWKKTLLFVVSDDELHDSLVEALSDFNLMVARSNSEAFAALDLSPDIVLLDARCAAVNVVQTCLSIRSGRSESPHLLVLLADSTPQSRVECYAAGADDVIQLPASPEEVVSKCRVHASLQREAQLSRLKSDVLDMFAHELRTPLTGILLATESLGTKGGTGGEDQDWFDLIRGCTRRLEMLADHGLLLCKLRSKMLELTHRHCDLVAIVQKVTKELEATANAQRVRIELRAPDQVTASVDPHYFEILMRSVLEGTQRWCRPDSTVFLTMGEDSEGPWLSLSAWTLPALATADHPFSDFAPRTAGGQLVGGQFGLSLARELVEALGGTFDLVATKTDELWLTCRFLREPPDRRAVTRHPTAVAAKIVIAGAVPVTLVDVSLTGCLLETAGMPVVEIQGATPTPISGRVARVVSRDGKLGLGVEFDVPLDTDVAAELVGRGQQLTR